MRKREFSIVSRSVAAGCTLAVAALLSPPAGAQSPFLRRVGLGTLEAALPSGELAIAAGGEHIAFTSASSNLVFGDTNGVADVFAVAVGSLAVTRVSLSSSGAEANAASFNPALSLSGQYIVFASDANNLVAGDTNNVRDVFLRDLTATPPTTVRVSVDTFGAQAGAACDFPSVSDDGNWITFQTTAALEPSDTNGMSDIYMRALSQNLLIRVSRIPGGGAPNGISDRAVISGNSTFVAYQSTAPNIVGSDTNAAQDVFRFNRGTGATQRLSNTNNVLFPGFSANAASTLPAIDSTGAVVAFESLASDIVPSDTNGVSDVFVYSNSAGVAARVSLGAAGAESNGASNNASISANGQLVAFDTLATNLLATPDLNLVRDIYLYDLPTATTLRASITASGVTPTAACVEPALGPHALRVAFLSADSTMVSESSTIDVDVFLRHDNLSPATYCTSMPNTDGCLPLMGFSGTPSASAGSGFTITTSQMVAQKAGYYFYSTVGPNDTPFNGTGGTGTLCVHVPTLRTGTLNSGGTSGVGCSGSFTLDFNTYAASGADPNLIPYAQVWIQAWSRDLYPYTKSLSDGLAFTLGP